MTLPRIIALLFVVCVAGLAASIVWGSWLGAVLFGGGVAGFGLIIVALYAGWR